MFSSIVCYKFIYIYTCIYRYVYAYMYVIGSLNFQVLNAFFLSQFYIVKNRKSGKIMIVIISPLHHFLLLYHALCFRIYLKRMPVTSVLCLVWTVLGETHLSTKEACSYHWSALSLSLSLSLICVHIICCLLISKKCFYLLLSMYENIKNIGMPKRYTFLLFS